MTLYTFLGHPAVPRQKLRRTLPTEIKESESLSMFKSKIKMYTVSRDCRLCKHQVENLGYISFHSVFLQ